MRKGALLLVTVLAALAATGTAWQATAASSDQTIHVVVELAGPSLADTPGTVRAPQRGGAGTARAARLDLASARSRQALARIAREQSALEQRILAAVPAARIHWRYQVVLNALSVVLPVRDLDRLERVQGIAHVTRSTAYRRQLDSAPGLIGAPALWAAEVASTGAGIKIGILDDGITPDHPFFAPAGYTAPAGFPKGVKALTSAKVIVARAFPPPNEKWKHAANPFDPENSEHGMHVAGIAAGNRDTPYGSAPQQRLLSGVAPGAFIGNYKILTVPTPGFGLDGNAAEIAAGIEAAVKDGMDVINLSIGEPAIELSRDLVAIALGAAARAGVVPVVAAGNDFDVVGEGSIDSPGSTPEAITVAAATKSSVVADFSSAGPTPISFGLKPDVTAPGVNITSSYPSRSQSWTSLSGTSMATPAVSGAVALLLQRHPSWTVAQVKSALATTGKPVYLTAGKKAELPPTRQGGGMIDLAGADSPLLFAQPSALSFGYLRPGQTVTRSIALTDAGGGSGEWIGSVQPVIAGKGVRLTLPERVLVPGRATVTVTVAADAPEGDSSGYLRLSGAADRRVAFWLRVTRPKLAGHTPTVLSRTGVHAGSTAGKPSLVSRYRYPDSGPALGVPTVLAGPEQVFRVRIRGAVANFGVVILSKSEGVDVHPRVVAAGDENRLTGMPGLPVDLNPYRNEFGSPTPVAGAIRPAAGLYDIVFDTPSSAKAGSFTFRYWVNDQTPPTVRLTTPTVSAGPKATLELTVTDTGAGVDPSALVVKVDDTQMDSTYDAASGKVIVPIPLVTPGRHTLQVSAADWQETRNMEDVPAILPNTRVFTATFTAR